MTGEVRRRGPATPVRYERERPGELPHVDVKKAARIPDGGGWRARGRGRGSAPGAGSSCLHVAVDDFSRVAYAEPLPDERKGTCAAFMARRLAFIDRYNWDRPHSACGGLPPMSRIPDVNNLLAHNT